MKIIMRAGTSKQQGSVNSFNIDLASQSQRARSRSRLLPTVVLLTLLLLSAGVGAATGSGHDKITLLVLAAPLVLLGLLLLIDRFALLVLALPITALAVPFEIGTGTKSSITASLLLALGLSAYWLATMLVHRRLEFARSPINRPALVFSTICCISLVWSGLWRDPILETANFKDFSLVQIASLLTNLASIAAALLIGKFAQSPARLKYIVGAFLIFGGLMTFCELLRIPQHILNDRGLWGTWLVIMAYGLLIAQPKLHWGWRALLLILIVLTMYQSMVVNALWISGWAPTIVAIFAATFLHSRKLFIVLVIIAALAGFGARGFFERVAADDYKGGTDERVGLWEQSWQITREHWLLGTGPAGYRLYYATFFPADTRSTHNNYLDIVSQFGITGMLVWFWLAITSVVEGMRIVRRTPPGFLHTLAISATSGWIAAQAAMFLGDWVLPFAYNQTISGFKYTVYSWLFLGTLISIGCILEQQPQLAKTTSTSV